MSEIAIKVENLSKRYTIGKQSHKTLRHSLANLFRPVGNNEEFWALKDINFSINKGEAIGIIGRNGAGKSTLLKLLSKITKPTTGRIEIDGRISSLLEVGTGFHPELTGRENIYLNGSLLGMSRHEISTNFDEILDFSGVEKFIDTPVKHYSSGMYVRLAFSVSAHLNSDILLVDEVLAVGDQEFQQKCIGKMDGIADSGKTILFVSHNLGLLSKLCNKFMVLDKGRITSFDENFDILNRTSLKHNKSESKFINPINLNKSNPISYDKDICFQTPIKHNGHSKLMLSVVLKNEVGQRVFISEIEVQTHEFGNFNFTIPKYFLNEGTYYLDINIKDRVTKSFVEKNENAFVFQVAGRSEKYRNYERKNLGIVSDPIKWSIN